MGGQPGMWDSGDLPASCIAVGAPLVGALLGQARGLPLPCRSLEQRIWFTMRFL
jgi:hypothetical protein